MNLILLTTRVLKIPLWKPCDDDTIKNAIKNELSKNIRNLMIAGRHIWERQYFPFPIPSTTMPHACFRSRSVSSTPTLTRISQVSRDCDKTPPSIEKVILAHGRIDDSLGGDFIFGHELLACILIRIFFWVTVYSKQFFQISRPSYLLWQGLGFLNREGV